MSLNADHLDHNDYDKLLVAYQAVQLQNEQLQQQLTVHHRTDQGWRQKLQMIQEMGTAVSSSLDLDRILDAIANQTVELLNINTCTIMLLEPPDELVWIASVGRPQEIQQVGRQKIDAGLSGWVATHRKTLQVERVFEHDLILHPKLAIKYGYCTYLGIPMRIQEKLIGVIELFSKQPVRFADEDVQMLEVVAVQAAIAVEKAQLFTEIKQRIHEVEWQYQVTQALSNELDTTQILYKLSEILAHALHATSVYISELRQKQTITLVSKFLVDTAVSAERNVRELGNHYQAHAYPNYIAVLKDGQMRTLYADYEELSAAEKQLFQKHNVQTIFLIPIIRAGITYGIAEIWDSMQKRTFTKREEHLADSIVQHAAGVIENARLFAQVRGQAERLEKEVNMRTAELRTSNTQLRKEITERTRVEDELQQKTASLLVINRIADTVYRVFDIETIYQSTANELIKYPGFAAATIQLLDKKEKALHSVAIAGFSQDMHMADVRIPLEGSVSAQAIRQAQIIQSRNLNKDTRIVQSMKEKLLQAGLRGVVSVPMVYGSDVIGTFNVLLNHENGLTKLEEEMLSSVSKTIGLAILNVEYVVQIETEIEERKQVEEALQIYMSDLKRSNLELQDFAYIASHDLQEPLRKIQAFGDRLSNRYGEQLDQRGLDYLRRMQLAAGRLRALIDNLLLFSQVTTGAQPFAEVDLNKVVTAVLEDLSVRIKETNALIEVAQLPIIDAEPMQMHQLLQNLIGNALKFVQTDIQPRIQIESVSKQDRNLATGMLTQQQIVQISIKDNGIGIEPQYQERIFQLFERLHSRQAYAGTGLGLAICRKIVDRHNGRIAIESQLGEGTTFTIILPKRQKNR